VAQLFGDINLKQPSAPHGMVTDVPTADHDDVPTATQLAVLEDVYVIAFPIHAPAVPIVIVFDGLTVTHATAEDVPGQAGYSPVTV